MSFRCGNLGRRGLRHVDALAERANMFSAKPTRKTCTEKPKQILGLTEGYVVKAPLRSKGPLFYVVVLSAPRYWERVMSEFLMYSYARLKTCLKCNRACVCVCVCVWNPNPKSQHVKVCVSCVCASVMVCICVSMP